MLTTADNGVRRDQYRLLLLLFLLLTWMGAPAAAQTTCTKDPSSTCKCTTDDGREIDLSPAAATSGHRYTKEISQVSTTELLQYNPCIGFSCGETSGVAVCDTTTPGASGSPMYAISVGLQNSVKFQFDSSKRLQAVYTAELYTSTITFVCSESTSGYGTFDMTLSATTYTGTLTSKYACFKAPGGGGGGGGISFGDVLLIIFFVGLLVYFVAGFLIQHFVRKEEGLDKIPNRTFWFALPGLVKDGFLFFLQKTGIRKSGDGQYERY